jgi:hypothetical protein
MKPRILRVAVLAVSTVFPIALLQTPGALAAEHGVKGCVLVEDTRSEVSTNGQLTGLENLKITLQYETVLGDLPILGELRTNASGCFSGSIYGLTVPASTEITATAILEDSQWEINEGKLFSVYQIDLGRKSVSAGGSANFGDITLESDDRDQDLYGAGLAWLSAKQARALFETHIGDFPGGLVGIEFPTSDSISNADSTGIRLTSSAAQSFSGTFLHEYGHVLNGRNNIWGTPNDYCARKEFSSYPKNRPPYTYIDPYEASGSSDPADKNSCGHGSTSAEYESEAITEGFADAFADWLSDRKCKNPSGYSYGLNFDGKMREMNYQGLLCDLADSDSSTTTYLHTYGEEGHLSLVSGLPGGRVPFVSGASAWVPSGTRIYEANLSTGSVATIGDLSRNGYVDVPKVVHVGDITCAKGNYKQNYLLYDLVCQDKFTLDKELIHSEVTVEVPPGPSNQTMPESAIQNPRLSLDRASVANAINAENAKNGSENPVRTSGHGWTVIPGSAFPDATFSLYDIDVSQGRLFAYGGIQYGAELVLYSTDPAVTPLAWREESRIQRWATTPFLMTVDATNSHLYLALQGVVLRCKFNRCANGGIQFAGSALKTGYLRGKKGEALLATIQNLFISSGGLFIQDDYGVSRVDLTSGDLEQFVGRGEDPVFLNNLALRSLYIYTSEGFGFHSDGVRSLYSGGYFESDEHRSLTDKTGTWLADHSKKVHAETYCGTDPVSKSASSVFFLHKKASTGDPDADQLFDAIKKSTSVSDSDLEQLKDSNWVTLNKSGCTFTGGSSVLNEFEQSVLTGRNSGTAVGDWNSYMPVSMSSARKAFRSGMPVSNTSSCGGVKKSANRGETKRGPLKYDRIRKPMPLQFNRAKRKIPRAKPAIYPAPIRLRAAEKQ